LVIWQEWRNHKFSYDDRLKTPPKANMQLGCKAVGCYRIVWILKKFIQQLNKIFARETVDLIHVLNVFQAAFTYFFKPMDEFFLKPFGKLKK
jgi:hypothetical protein